MKIKRFKLYSQPAKVRLVSLALAGVILLSGCSRSFTTHIRKGEDSYRVSSLEVLINEEELYHICEKEQFKKIESTEYGYRNGYGYNPSTGKYEYGYTIGEISKSKTLYSYIDIDSAEKIADDEDMNGFTKTNLSKFFSEEEYEDMNGSISYEDVIERIDAVINVPAKKK